MDEQYEIQVSDITRKEFTQAGGELLLRFGGMALAIVTVVTVLLILIMDEFSVQAMVSPYVVVLGLLCVFWIMMASSYKKFPKDIEYSYLIDSDGWQITVKDISTNVDWQDTVRMVVRRHAILFFQEENRSNLLPRRCVSDHQLAMMRTWYQASRPAYRARRQAKERQQREERRQRARQKRGR